MPSGRKEAHFKSLTNTVRDAASALRVSQGSHFDRKGKKMKKVISANQAVSYAVLASKTQVIAAYPITPQSSIVEMLAGFCADGRPSGQIYQCGV